MSSKKNERIFYFCWIFQFKIAFSDIKEVIELFSFDNGSNTEEIEKSVCDPNDREKGLECLRLVKRFGNYIEEGKFQAAAKLAMSSNVFYSINTLERLRNFFEIFLRIFSDFCYPFFELSLDFLKDKFFKNFFKARLKKAIDLLFGSQLFCSKVSRKFWRTKGLSSKRLKFARNRA